MKLRHSLALLALMPVLIFSFAPLGPQTVAFQGPAVASVWTA